MKRSALTGAVASALFFGCAGLTFAQQAYLGELRLFPYNFCPQGWSSAQGQIIPIAQNQALFSLLGINWGGDGKKTFALPKASTPPTNMNWCVALQGIFPSRP